jgi:hypothetical protein
MDPKKGEQMEIRFSFAALFTDHQMTSRTDTRIPYLLEMTSTSAFLALAHDQIINPVTEERPIPELILA